jgi:glycosyltransferase involved in cell wall biosynthesis
MAATLRRSREATPRDAPRVTVVVATFNRSSVLVYALRSIVAQSFEDWEAIVIGDHCTDDTQSIVDSIADPRVMFLNLSENMGDQSGPNSLGIRLARGDFVAFLSQDDLWFPDHLATLLNKLVASSADMVVATGLTVRALSSSSRGGLTGSLETITRPDADRVQPLELFLASGWLMSRKLAWAMGDWKSATTVRFASSQEYLYRCWSWGARIVFSPARSFVVIPSIIGANAYSTRRSSAHEIIAPIVMGPDRAVLDQLLVHLSFEEPIMRASAIATPVRILGPTRLRIARHGGGIYRRTVAIAVRLGFAPWEYRAMIGGLEKGGTNTVLRALRGLDGR